MAKFGLFPRSGLLQSLPTPCTWSFSLVVFPFHLNRFAVPFIICSSLPFIFSFAASAALLHLPFGPFIIWLRPLINWLRPFINWLRPLYQLAPALLPFGFGPLLPIIWRLCPPPFSFALWAPLSFGSGPFLFPGHRPPLLASALYHSAVALAEHSVGFPPSSPLASGTLTGPFPLAVTFSSRASQRFIFLSVCSIEFSSASPGAPFPRLSVSPGSNCRLHTCMTVPT